ncbi:hypothetical protein CF336_g5769 [Tilletia laevis]|nr:hypothetical protein CF336_g5769 [Tilletia laevis]
MKVRRFEKLLSSAQEFAIKITTCQPSGRPYNSAAREVIIMKKQRSVNVMSLLDVVYKQFSGQHQAELWLVMDCMPTNLRAPIMTI